MCSARAQGVDESAQVNRCITTYTTAATELLVAGHSEQPAVFLSAGVYLWGVVMMEMIGTQHPEFPQLKPPQGMNEDMKLPHLHKHRMHTTMKVCKPRFHASPELKELFELSGTKDPRRPTD